jgi:outer membrane protein TolC
MCSPRILLPIAAVLAAIVAADARAQVPGQRPLPPAGLPDAGPFSGGVPTGQRTSEPIPLTLADALARGLQHNVAAITGEQDIASAEGEQWRARSELLPNLSGLLAAERQVINLAALGFSDFPGVPQIIGPFNVFDARLAVTQPVIDVQALRGLRQSTELVDAARHQYRNTRDLVVVAVTNLYLQALSAESRVAAVRAQLETADALAVLAEDRRRAGLVPAIDSLRAEVQRQTERQRLIVAENTAAKQKLVLTRAIGLPLGQAITLADPMPYAPASVPDLDAAVKDAYAHREDLLSQQAAVNAARAGSDAASAAHLPSLQVDANWGAIGQTPEAAVPTYTMSANVRVPIFNGGADKARSIEAAAALKRQEAALEDVRARVYYEVEAALLDVTAAQRQVDVAVRSVELAEQQLAQARDRFAAGVADTIEVVQAQDAVAAAHDSRVATLYAFNTAKAALATALGLAEEQMPQFLGAQK